MPLTTASVFYEGLEKCRVSAEMALEHQARSLGSRALFGRGSMSETYCAQRLSESLVQWESRPNDRHISVQR
ncbi:Uncharacterized protein HZ326_6436 [Fusarium oxysporum f. sp. albedinis]|nr:Uncharacterized protein HZ326_6436 [Fusarium oxysporum f. sp. albedinis]